MTGALYVACAAGLRRALRPGRAGTWGPPLVGVLGVGLVMGGVFLTDAGAGFPPGAPAGAPEITWHGALHGAGAMVAFTGMSAGCLVFARRFAALRRWGWVTACAATAVAVLALSSWPDPEGMSVRLLLASAILFGFVAALAVRVTRGLPDAPAHRRTVARRKSPVLRT